MEFEPRAGDFYGHTTVIPQSLPSRLELRGE